MYDLASGTPTVPVATLNNPGPAGGDWFGYSVMFAGLAARLVAASNWALADCQGAS